MDATSLLGAMLGSGFGRGRGPSLGTVAAGAAGVAAVGGLGYLAYRHFQGQKGAQPPPAGAVGMTPQGGAPGWGAPMGAAPAPGGGVGGFFSNIAGSAGGMRTDGFSVPGYEWQQGGGAQAQQPQPQQPRYAPPPAADAPPAAPPVDYASLPAQPPSPYAAPAQAQPQQNEQAMLLVRAMIAAAYADGTIDDAERADILARLDGAGIAAGEREAFVRELASPKPVTALAAEVKSPDLAEQFYVVSLLSMKIDSDAERAYARMLPSLLQLSPERVAAIHQKAGLPAVS